MGPIQARFSSHFSFHSLPLPLAHFCLLSSSVCMNKDFQGPLYCLKKPVHSPAKKNAGWAIYGEGKGTQTKRERAALRWCNDTQCLQSLEILRIILETKTNSLFKNSSNYLSKQRILNNQADFIVCAVCPSDVDMTPCQPIRGECVHARGWGYSSRRWEGRCGYFLVVAGCR